MRVVGVRAVAVRVMAVRTGQHPALGLCQDRDDRDERHGKHSWGWETTRGFDAFSSCFLLGDHMRAVEEK